MKIVFKKRGKKKFEIDVKSCDISSTGLMFTRKENAKALLFDLGKSSRLALTSIFVFFDFIAIWLDEKNNVLDLKVCKPWRLFINTNKKFNKILEIPCNEKYSKLINSLGKL